MNEAQLLSVVFSVYSIAAVLYGVVFFKDSLTVRRLALWVLGIGFILHTGALIMRWNLSGHAPFSNMYESLIFFAWAFILSFLVLGRFFNVWRLGFFILAFNLTLFVYAFSHDAGIKPLMPALQSNWMLLHVIACFLSYGAFAISFLVSLVYITPLHKKIASRELLDTIIYKSILFGFPLLTLGVTSGAVWANEAWGTYWSWDPKETWSLITWFIYALYLHLRLMKGWYGKKLAWVAFTGFLSVIFTYVGVSYLMSGLHSYA